MLRKIKRIFFILIIFIINTRMQVFATTLPINGGELVTGTYTLESDMTITNTLSISENQNVIIDLNGYVLQPESEGYRMINNYGTLTINDSRPNSPHYGEVTYKTSIKKGGIWKYNSSTSSGTLISGGIICGSVNSNRGGCIYNKGNLIMNAGTIAGCVTTGENSEWYGDGGGAVFTSGPDAIFTMNEGATISYCLNTDPSTTGQARWRRRYYFGRSYFCNERWYNRTLLFKSRRCCLGRWHEENY